MTNDKKFSEYQSEGHLWITLSTGDYYPDILPLACELYRPVLVTFGQLLKSSHSSTDLFSGIAETKPQWIRIQLCRVFKKYVSPETPVEMLKKKSAASQICEQFGKGFREVTEVQKRFEYRPMPDEALCAILWEYKDRGGAQEDDRTGQYRDCANEISEYARKNSLNLKVIFLNDGPGLLLGSMWRDYAYIEDCWPGLVKVVTSRMVKERISLDWLLE